MPVLGLLTSLALGFTPSSTSTASDAELQRVQTLRAEVQLELRRSAPWRRFVEIEGAGWQAVFDEHTGTPRTLWGGGTTIPAATPSLVSHGVITWLQRHAALFGIEGEALRVESVELDPSRDTWYVDVDVLHEGLPVWRSGIRARVRSGKLVLVHAATTPRAEVTGGYAITEGDAIARAIAASPAPAAVHTDQSATQQLLDRKTLQAHELRRTWVVRTHTAEPPGIWVSFVDGASGEILHAYNDVRFIKGTVEAEHHERSPLDPLTVSPVWLATVSGEVDDDVTDDIGVFDVTAGATYDTDFAGTFLTVNNEAGAEGALSSTKPGLLWTSADATQAEIDTYVFTHQVKAWGERVAPDVDYVFDPLVANVNIASTCNAYYNGQINFFLAGGGCNNTGENADVVYHEWGHGFHFGSLLSGGFDGSLGEGAADVVAFLQTGSSLIGPGFLVGGGAVRDVAPDRIYPQDFTGSVHGNGLIFGGTIWDLWALLVIDEGEADGKESVEQIFAGLLKGGTDIPGTWGEALLADDDDNDLRNGTPHICRMAEAFGAHGIGPTGEEPLVWVDHEPLTVADQGDHLVSFELVTLAAGCAPLDVQAATVHYRVAGGAWTSVALAPAGASASGVIPAQTIGTIVEYYIEGVSENGDDFELPSAGTVRPFSFVVGPILELDCDTFDADDGGYVSELVAGKDVDGANDWQWGIPAGGSDDPSAAFSGDYVWGNDLAPEGFNGAYQADKVNALTAPVVETGHYTEVLLQYRRWLHVEDGVADQATILVNGQPMWTNFVGDGTNHHQDRGWMHHVVNLQGEADMGSAELRWELASNASNEFGGWTLDDVCVIAPATPDNRLGITDFAASVVNDTRVALTWTHPRHAPVQAVRVVRRSDTYPTGAEDGQVVHEVSNPDLESAARFVDTQYEAGDTFYAVYGFDGTDWLSWTIEGMNAAQVDLVGGEPPAADPGPTFTERFDDPAVEETPLDPTPTDPTDGEPASQCGCQGTGTGAPLPTALVLLVGLIAARRRAR